MTQINLPNLFWVKFDPYELIRDTPLLTWWRNDEVKRTPFRTVHALNAGRYAIFFYKYGGFYSDLDTIAVKSFEKTGVGFLNETWNSLGNGFLYFTKHHFSRRHS